MQELTDYTITEKIHESVHTVVYRGKGNLDNISVAIKIPKSEYPTVGEIIRFRNQYTIAKNLDLEEFIKPYNLIHYNHGFAIIMEDYGGISLKEYFSSKKVSIKEFLEIAIQIADALEALYQNRIIHKDIKPQNILINPKSKQVKITDFSISSLLPKETQSLISPNQLEGTLAYISPEQTGRMNRGIDYRTDLYSLGVTFYEMLTGQLPFQSTELMELVHCHIAKQPLPASQVNPEIPLVISDIVMKLMAKTAENRYQSARGLKADLETCLTELEKTGNIPLFVVGQKDNFEIFQIPEKLYGRETEIESLMAAFDRVSEGRTEMMLVAGYSGIGKSALVHEVHKPIVRQRGYFISGKFDQFKRNIPLASIIQAFQDLIRQLLTESSDKIAIWKEKLTKVLGINGQVIIDVIPEVELLIGKQSPVTELGPTESQNRFNLVFQNLIRVFAAAEHPLVLFLDDLQWADSTSLKLIEILMTETDTKYLFLIGAYRDNEVSGVHPTIITINKIKEAGVTVNSLLLQALDLENLNYLISESLKCPEERAKALSELIFQKTQGNPFFATQFLKSLYEDGILFYNYQFGYWECDIAKVKALAITDDVVEFMASQLQKLPFYTQEVLKLAACIGNTFNLETLGIVYERSQPETATDLWKALQSGLILPLSDVYKFYQDEAQKVEISSNSLSVNYKFLHDRVQQAAYSLIPEKNKQKTHLKIGQLLLKNTPDEQREEKIFDIVNQLNVGVDLISIQSEKNELASLNLIAGKKAKSATAYEPALKYFNIGLKMLSTNSWQTQYEITLKLYIEAAEAEYLNGNHEKGKELSEIVITTAKNLLEKVKIYELQIQFYVSLNQPTIAIELAQKVLNMLGIKLPTQQSEVHSCITLLRSELNREINQVSILANLPIMTDPYKLATMRILVNVASATYMANPTLLELIVLTMVKLSITSGKSPQAANAFCYYGIFLCGVYGEIDAGYEFGKLGVKILEQFNAREIRARVINLFNVFVIHWKQHIKEAIEPLRESIQIGIETGDLEYAFYNAVQYGNHLLFSGEQLEFVNQQQQQYIEMMEKLKLDFHINYASIWRQIVLNLLGKSSNPYELVGESFDAGKMLPLFIEKNNFLLGFCTACCQMILWYLFKQNDAAIAGGELAEKYAQSATGFISHFEHKFYYTLALIASCFNLDCLSDNKDILKQVELNQKQMKVWAEYCPANFQHKYDLIAAEKARVFGQKWEAAELYDRAILGGKEQGYIQEEALANELAAEFYLSLGREKIAKTYLTDAYYCYARWGANAKVKDLESRYPQYLAAILLRNTPGNLSAIETISPVFSSTQTSTTKGGSDVLDLAAVMKASNVISEEIVLEKLLEKLMRVILENAGAEKGFMVMKKDDNFVIEASATILDEDVKMLSSIPIENSQIIPTAIVYYVDRTKQNLVLNNGAKESIFVADPYIAKVQPKSILCMPIIHKGKHLGIIYLENNQSTGVFTQDRLEVLKLLSSQAAISLENALLYRSLQETEKREREKATQLAESLHSLQEAQLQLIQSEKMSSLGQLIAGIAHEINNPVGFISGNLDYASEYIQDLVNLVELYQQNYPEPVAEITAELEAIELDYLIADLTKIIASMKAGTDRIRNISNSMRTFSRADTIQKVTFNIHEGIDSTLMILKHRLKANDKRPGIEVIKEYGNLPEVMCYPGQLNQVFMNLIANAIDAFDELNEGRDYQEIKTKPNTIKISTELTSNNQNIVIKIKDNGPGITEVAKHQVFDHLFTTKAVGKGTGLGLSISRQIIEVKHGGKIQCLSSLGEGAEFIIEISIK